MPYNESIADKVRETLVDVPKVEERNLFGGVCLEFNPLAKASKKKKKITKKD